jgi:chitinase
MSATTLDPADDTTAPPAPGALRSTARTATGVSLAWNAVSEASGIAGYDVYRDGQLATSVSGTTATVTGLTPLTAYTFTVRARDTFDNASPVSAAVKITTDDVVGAGKYAKVGYFVQWGVYGRQYFVKNLDTSGAAAKLTHLNYAFANLDPVNLTCLQGVTKGTTQNPQDPDQGTGAGDAERTTAGPSARRSPWTVWPIRAGRSCAATSTSSRSSKATYPHLKVPGTRATSTATRRTRTPSSSAWNGPCGRTPTPGSTPAS